MVTVESQPKENYLTAEYGIRSWLLATDHKRIALLYLVSIAFFFAIAGVFAMMIRIHLLTPDGTAHPQNAMSCMTCAAFGRGFESRRPRTFLRFGGPALRLLLFPATETRWYQAMPVGWKNHVASEPEILRDKPRLKGTRIPLGLSSDTSPLSKPLKTLSRSLPISRAPKSLHVWTMPANWLNLRPSSDGVAVLGRRAAGSAQGSRTGRLHLFLKFFFGLHPISVGRLNLRLAP